MSGFFAHLDKIFFLNINIWDFSFHSLLREYVWIFFCRAILTHPLKAAKGSVKYRDFIKSREGLISRYKKSISIPDKFTFFERIKRKKEQVLVGLGFCLKPYILNDTSCCCPSGRANHDCLYLETGKTHSICLSCKIYEVAKKCLESGCLVYIMTSAKDIALDFLIPQMNSSKFPSAILLLCPYSIQAIIPALLICRIEMHLIAYSRGHCQDFPQWLQADRGVKVERTSISQESDEKLFDILNKIKREEGQFRRFLRKGNIFFPE